MRYIRWHRRPCVEATTCPTAARPTAVVICVHTGDAVSRILVVWWKREAICAACRLNKSASLLTACIVFRVAAGEPFFHYGKVFLRRRLIPRCSFPRLCRLLNCVVSRSQIYSLRTSSRTASPVGYFTSLMGLPAASSALTTRANSPSGWRFSTSRLRKN